MYKNNYDNNNGGGQLEVIVFMIFGVILTYCIVRFIPTTTLYFDWIKRIPLLSFFNNFFKPFSHNENILNIYLTWGLPVSFSLMMFSFLKRTKQFIMLPAIMFFVMKMLYKTGIVGIGAFLNVFEADKLYWHFLHGYIGDIVITYVVIPYIVIYVVKGLFMRNKKDEDTTTSINTSTRKKEGLLARIVREEKERREEDSLLNTMKRYGIN